MYIEFTLLNEKHKYPRIEYLEEGNGGTSLKNIIEILLLYILILSLLVLHISINRIRF